MPTKPAEYRYPIRRELIEKHADAILVDVQGKPKDSVASFMFEVTKLVLAELLP